MITITESEMHFGQYQEESVFQIEKCDLYRRLAPEQVKCCEFLLFRQGKLCFLEAKKSCPNQITAQSSAEKQRKYKEYIDGIVTKMRHSLALYANILLHNQSSADIPDTFCTQDLSQCKIQLILVVKNAEMSWLVPLQEKLNSEMHADLKIWNIQRFFVINEETAKRKGFITDKPVL